MLTYLFCYLFGCVYVMKGSPVEIVTLADFTLTLTWTLDSVWWQPQFSHMDGHLDDNRCPSSMQRPLPMKNCFSISLIQMTTMLPMMASTLFHSSTTQHLKIDNLVDLQNANLLSQFDRNSDTFQSLGLQTVPIKVRLYRTINTGR